MPPTKGPPIAKQQNLGFKNVKLTHKATSKAKGKKGRMKGRKFCAKPDEELLKLRIPCQIRNILPSVKKFNGKMNKLGTRIPKKEPVKLKVEPEAFTLTEDLDTKMGVTRPIFGSKRKRGEQQKYHIQLVHEERYKGMICDLALCKNGNIVISYGKEAVLCHSNLEQICKLEKLMLPGGIAFLPDDGIVIICRHLDTVNFFTSSGKYLRTFDAGPSPQTLVINSKGDLIVSDTGAKNVRIYSQEGVMLRVIPNITAEYRMKWPLYLALNSYEDLLVVDCHQQEVWIFDSENQFRGEFPIKTTAGSKVLRPHGICSNKDDDVFLIDTAIDSLEVFRNDGSFMQTLLIAEEGKSLKLKVVAVSDEYLILGGMMGLVSIYKFVSAAEHSELKVKVKKEIKDVIVID